MWAQDPAILASIERAPTGVGKWAVEQVVLTHSHSDHCALLAARFGRRFTPGCWLFRRASSASMAGCAMGTAIRMGDRLFEVIHTPGHSSDSICLYNEAEGVLFAGDSPLLITSSEGNYEAGFRAALEKLCARDVRRIYFGHGPPLTERCNERLRESQRLAASSAPAGEGRSGSRINAGGGEITKQECKGATTMARQTSNGRAIDPAAERPPAPPCWTARSVNDPQPGMERRSSRSCGPGAIRCLHGQVAAIRKSQAVIEFAMDGRFSMPTTTSSRLGYTLDEIKGQHHSMFVEPAYRQSAEYREFWASLNRGEYQAAEYKRIGKGGKEVWIQASYNPILDPDGKPFKVVKFATDVTAQKLPNADYSGQVAAIGKSQAVIEFKMDGTVLTANDNFLKALGYTLDEIKGRHHSMFVDEAYRQSNEYKEFWAALNVASTRRRSTSAWARAVRRSGFRLPTTRSWTSMASPSRWSSMPPTSRRRSWR